MAKMPENRPGSGTASAPLRALAVEHVRFQPGRMTVTVSVSPPFPRITDETLAAYACAAFPELSRHRCLNGRGPLFSAVMDCTPVPHLLEHLIISLQARDERQDPCFSLVGSTEWLNEAEGRARVAVSFSDDLIAAQAMDRALRFLDEGMVRFHDDSSHHVRSDRR